MDNVSEFFSKEGSSGLIDLEWLHVDPKEYAKTETLPLQNLDIVPDLAALWSHEDKPAAAYLMPNRGDVPKAMGDLSDTHGSISKEAVVRVARLLLMQTTDVRKIHDGISKRFSKQDILGAKKELAEIFSERGLLGPYYLAAQDFPGCSQGKTAVQHFVNRFASSSRYVVAKDDCEGCTQKIGTNCAVFHKQLVPSKEVLFSEEMADKVEQQKKATGKLIPVSQLTSKPKDRIRNAFLSPDMAPVSMQAPHPVLNPAQLLSEPKEVAPVVVAAPLISERAAVYSLVDWLSQQGRISVEGVREAALAISLASEKRELVDIVARLEKLEAAPAKVYDGPVPPRPKVSSLSLEQGLLLADNLLKKQDQQVQAAMAENKARPIVALLRRELLKGSSFETLKKALHLSFDPRDLVSTRDQWVPLIAKAGLLGTLYTKQDFFGTCSEGVSFLNKYASPVRYVVKGSKCEGCIHNKIGRCLLYNRPLLASENDVLTAEEVQRSADNLVATGKVLPHEVASFGKLTPEQALKEAYKLAHRKDRPVLDPTSRVDTYRAWAGNTDVHAHTVSELTVRSIVTATRRYMNEGLYGRELGVVLRKAFDVRDLKAAKEALKPLVAEQGLQGIFYADPSVYADYGKGCEEPSRLFRASAIPYLKVGSSCKDCLHQTKPGFCSKINKPLVIEPPYLNKEAQRREVLASGNTMVVPPEQLINYGGNMLAEFQMQNPMDVDIEAEHAPEEEIEVSFGESGEITW